MTTTREQYYSLILSKSQGEYLANSKYGIDRMKALVSLIELAAISEHKYQKKGFSTTVQVGQVIVSEVELSHLLGCDRKTVSRILDKMNQLGLVSTVQTNRTSIHNLLCISAWIIDGKKILNPFYVPLMKRHDNDSLPDTDSATHGVEGSAPNASSPTSAEHCTSQEQENRDCGSPLASSNTPLSTNGCLDKPEGDSPIKNNRRKKLKSKKRKKK